MSAPPESTKPARLSPKAATATGTGIATSAAAMVAIGLKLAGRAPWAGPVLALGVVALALLGTPLFAVMGGAAEVGLIGDDKPLRFLGEAVLNEHFAKSKILVTIPLYTFVGYLLAESKTPDRLVRAARAVLGWLPGGLAIVCVFASALFTLLTGGSGVTIIAVGGLLYPALRKQSYSDRFSLGLVTSGGSVGLLLPLSLPLIVYATVARVDIERSFKAVLLPGAIVIFLLALYSMWVARKERIPREAPRLAEIGAALWEVKWEAMMPVILVGGMMSGLAEIHEIAGVVAAYVLCVHVFITKDLSWKKDVLRIVKSSMSLAGAIVIILAFANALMDWAIVEHHVPTKVLELMKSVGIDKKWQLLLVLNVFLLILGMLMEGFSAILVGVPLVLPLIAQLGRDPVNPDPSQTMSPFQLAMIFLLNLELAFCLPPLGLNLFISSFRFNRPVTELYRVVLPFVGILAASLLLVTYVPQVSTVLVQGDIDKMRDEASGQVRLAGLRPEKEGAARKAVDAAERELKAMLGESLQRLGGAYRALEREAAEPQSFAYLSVLNGGMADVSYTLDASGAFKAGTCALSLQGKVATVPIAKKMCDTLVEHVSSWKVSYDKALEPLASGVMTFLLEGPRAPVEAWNLECVQEDPLSAKPCSKEEIDRFGNDGRKPLPPPPSLEPAAPQGTDAGATAAADAESAEQTLEEQELERELRGDDAAAPLPKAEAGATGDAAGPDAGKKDETDLDELDLEKEINGH